MAAFFIALVVWVMLFALFFGLPILIAQFRVRESKKVFESDIASLCPLYQKCVSTLESIVGSRLLGEGGSQNSSITFADALKNQSFAIQSILDLIDDLEG